MVFDDYQRVKLQEIEEETYYYTGEDDTEAAAAGGGSAVTAGRAPRTFEMELRGSYLLDSCIPGDVVRVVGVLKSLQTEGGGQRRGRGGGIAESGLHQLYLLANSLTVCSKEFTSGEDGVKGGVGGGKKRCSVSNRISNRKRHRGAYAYDSDFESDSDHEEGFFTSAADNAADTAADTTSRESQEPASSSSSSHSHHVIQSLALNEHCLGLLVGSLCPLIFGHELVKMGLLLGLMGAPSNAEVGESQSSYSTPPASVGRPGGGSGSGSGDNGAGNDSGSGGFSVRTRSNIHVLVVGDPGLGKSQMLRAAAKVAPRAVRSLLC